MGPKVGLNGCGKSRPKLGFDFQTAQLVVCHYTDVAILTQRLHSYSVSCCVMFLLGLRKISQHASVCLSVSVWSSSPL